VSEPSDEALLAAHLRGDPRAFGALVARHERRIYGLCLRILGNREDAEDAAQEAFLAALRKAATFRKAAAFSTWLYRIAVNAATDQARRRSRARLTALDPEDAGLAADPAGDLGETVTAAVAVQTALTHVPEEFRVAVVLCDLYRLPYADAAQILEVPVGTVKSRVFRGRLALAEHLSPAPEGSGTAADRTQPGNLHAAPEPGDAGTPGAVTGEGRPGRPGGGRGSPESPDAAGDRVDRGVPARPGPERPPLRVVGGTGTEAGSRASDPTEADRPNQE
jgi:RNA polymerase sigma-70 factor (ECF subfamily)